MFIRKLLDFCFTKRELSWLDDLIPESKKKKDDDKKKKEKEVSHHAELWQTAASSPTADVCLFQDARRMMEEVEDEPPYHISFPIKDLKRR